MVALHRKYCEDVVDMGGGKTSGDVLLAEFQRQRKHLEGLDSFNVILMNNETQSNSWTTSFQK